MSYKFIDFVRGNQVDKFQHSSFSVLNTHLGSKFGIFRQSSLVFSLHLGTPQLFASWYFPVPKIFLNKPTEHLLFEFQSILDTVITSVIFHHYS